MTFSARIEENFKNTVKNIDATEPLFIPTSKEDIHQLIGLIGADVTRVIDFYQKSQPNNLPVLESMTSLLNVEGIIRENTEYAPGAYLSNLGIYVFAVTLGGNAICIDVNDKQNGDPVVLLVDHTFLYCDEDTGECEIDCLPSYIDESSNSPEDFEFNYDNVRKFVYKIENSFTEFMEKFSKDEYDDLENFL